MTRRRRRHGRAHHVGLTVVVGFAVFVPSYAAIAALNNDPPPLRTP